MGFASSSVDLATKLPPPWRGRVGERGISLRPVSILRVDSRPTRTHPLPPPSPVEGEGTLEATPRGRKAQSSIARIRFARLARAFAGDLMVALMLAACAPALSREGLQAEPRTSAPSRPLVFAIRVEPES